MVLYNECSALWKEGFSLACCYPRNVNCITAALQRFQEIFCSTKYTKEEVLAEVFGKKKKDMQFKKD